MIKGEVAGIPLTFIDTPGLEPSAGALASNLRRLRAAKAAFNRHKPQAVLYIDRLDAGRRDLADLNVGDRQPGGRQPGGRQPDGRQPGGRQCCSGSSTGTG